jgi:DNA adenine methylase
MTFFRYPGGKSKFKKIILDSIKTVGLNNLEYREPFFGGGSVGLNVIPEFNPLTVWINDKDFALYSLWKAVRDYPDELKNKIQSYKPSVDDFYKFKDELLKNTIDENDTVNLGFMKLVSHQISFSGLGTCAGGPLGGKSQSSKYPIDCRWSPDYICKKIDKNNRIFNAIPTKITNVDFEELILDPTPAFIYLDPPYWEMGQKLYQHFFTEQDHIRLAKCLKNTNHKWVLSYDNIPEIQNLYSWAKIEVIGANYTINTSTKKTELIITNF